MNGAKKGLDQRETMVFFMQRFISGRKKSDHPKLASCSWIEARSESLCRKFFDHANIYKYVFTLSIEKKLAVV
jgi:hypothetical protein